ncbi:MULTISPECIES: sigma-70 family RNA polymerase sigma factor [Pseudomonas]|jgi:RNA polymerase sigma factor (sigma-70 family)|uniref:Sigma-70 family RNA polymerase sigma factor n=1 Tax=Pseudomonas rhodesiae TaxID=76760 RepID=A0A8I1E6Q9_9PSED|nr:MULTISPECIES: sigma-70 family RNA polymerase sigma factor [Pseudomonas]MBI6599474.1 sigma-70 family RNA polymerase sigma factor [Pseudomonas sp. S4_EA_1b]MBI6626681.1 sigma-70 family RNA polymerase sigma factor [Pseudomonas rhodesiae]
MSIAVIGKPDLLTEIFRSDYRWLAERLRYRLGCRYNAEDVASESFLQLSTLPALESVREPRAMLTTIANRVLYEVSRRKTLEKAYLLALASAPEKVHPSPEEQHMLLESLVAIDKVLDGLSSKARQAFLYSQLDGMTYAQIADKLGVSASMVRQYMTKALTQCYLVTAQR